MEKFRFQNKTEILFGRDTQRQVGNYVSTYAKKVLIVYGSERIQRNGLMDEILESLEKAGVETHLLGGVIPNPRLSKVYEGIELCKKHDISFILAVGGGSVIDTAKAIVLCGQKKVENIWDFFIGKERLENTTIQLGVVLTIAASGSESSGSTVLTNDMIEPMQKRDYTSNYLRPCFAILNPELTVNIPWEQTACGGIDILSHVMERYFTKVSNVELSDRLCEATMITVINNMRILKDNLSDYNARAELMWAGTIAHNNLLSAGRRSDWASHMMEHELSAMFDIPHGMGLAMIIPSWMKYVYKSNIERFAQYGERVWNLHVEDRKKLAEEAIFCTEAFLKQMELPITTNSLDLTDECIEHLAKSATKYGTIGDFVILDERSVAEIYRISRG